MTEENYNYRTSQTLLRNQFPGKGKLQIPIIPKFQERPGDFDDLLLIGFDKTEIMDYAQKIGTYETSILPYEDCCTIFTPKHPQTRPQVEQLLESEKLIDGEGLMKRAIEGIEVLNIKP